MAEGYSDSGPTPGEKDAVLKSHPLIVKPIQFVLLIVPLLLGTNAAAQYSNMRFEHISTPEGLSQDIVKVIAHDSSGFMWFGTEDGLNRYDGYSIKVYKNNPRDSGSISGNDVHDIYEDSRGRLWIGTDNGLNLYDRHRDAFVRIGNTADGPGRLSSQSVTSIRQDREGNLWIGTNIGLNRYHEAKNIFIHYESSPSDSHSIPANDITSLLLDKAGVLWIATGNGFCRFDERDSSFVRYLKTTRPAQPANISSLYEDRSGTIWAAHTEHGLWRLDPSRKKLSLVPIPTRLGLASSPHFLGDAVVNSVCEDSRGYVWIGHFAGVDIYDPRTNLFTHIPIIPNSPSAVGGRVNTLYRDRAGAMWLGTFQGGVNRYDPNSQKFLLYRHDPHAKSSLSSNYVLSVLEDRTGAVWVGTDNGLDRLNPATGEFRHFHQDASKPRSLGSDLVNALLEDRDGRLWIGGSGGSGSNLDRFDPATQTFDHYSIMSVKSLYEDREGNLWVGLLDEKQTGPNLIKLDRNRKISGHYSVSGSGVWSIFQDRKGDLWFGGQYCCLNRLDKSTGKFHPYVPRANDTTWINSGAVRAMLQDDEGIIWFGTWGNGLFGYDPAANRFSRMDEADGLANNYVKGILRDGGGHLWIATERGLCRFDPKTRAMTTYTTEDGLQGDRFLSGSCYKGKGGWMYFGGNNGLNVFHPDSIRDNQNIPAVVITSFKVFDKPLSQSGSPDNTLRLSYNQDFFSFEFVALDYTSPEKNQYAYQLEGFDRDWVQAGTRRYAAYTGVPPGSYTFRVRGSNNDGVWNNEGAALQIVIGPPYWRTWWFALLATLASVAVLYTLYRYRINQVLAIERLRSRIAADLHDDVGTDLSSIVLASQLMERKLPLTEKQKVEVRQIGSMARRTQEMMRDIVWVLNSKNDTVDDLLLKMREATARILSTIAYTFRIPEAPLPERMSLEFKRTIFLFYKECLNNIVKHSDASEVRIEIRPQNRGFTLTIEDNGRGFNPGSHTAGLGLKSLKARADHIGGEFAITSEEGRGTKISLVVRIT